LPDCCQAAFTKESFRLPSRRATLIVVALSGARARRDKIAENHGFRARTACAFPKAIYD